ncbi:cysteine proteinase [Pleurotus eryngii]|uniref:Cysteine proteinase n=1 Tax=Pleurotus eryngii TaxID=5323 RepID=A0A9P6A5S6_PLEER|nr:cysteine proteinase [Pleurotus eryngii]
MASNVLPQKDRNSINELSSAANGTDRRPPKNNRDASSRAIWKNQTATAIPVPGQSRRRLTDPYTPTTFTANRTASQTLTKRPKRPPSRINLRETELSVIRGKSKGKQKAVLAPPYDVVNVDDDEDLGQPLPLSATRAHSSPDQLDCIRDRIHSPRLTELETQVRLPPIHPFEQGDDANAPSSSKASHIFRHHTQSSSDPIEEYQPSLPPARPTPTLGRVREMVSEINAHNQSIGLGAPHVDLAKQERAKTKDRMKPKRGKILVVGAAPHVQNPRLQVKRAFIGLDEFGEKQTSFQYSSKQLILTIHCKPPKSLTFALDREVFRLSMSNRQADEPFLAFSATRFGYLRSSHPQLDQSEEGSIDSERVLLLFEDDQPGLKDKIAGLVEVTRSLDGAEYLDGAGARGMFEREMRLLEDLKRQRSSDGSEGSKTRRTVPTTKPISGVKRKIPDEEDQVTPRKRSTNPSQDVSIMDHKSSAEAVGPRRRSARQILIADDALRQPRQPRLDPDEIILVYPPNTTGAVTIKNSDLERLRPGEFLNDTLIEFGLKLWLKDLEESHPELAKDVYVFSSFFYKKLKVRNVEDGYQSVRKWTSKFDIFQKKYIIVPINENLHWYLAIIYEPEHILLPPVTAPPRLTRKMGWRKATDAPVNNVALSKIPQTPEEDLAELTNEMLISPRDRSKTPSDVQEVVDQLEPESEDELIGGGPTDSPLTDMEALESVHATGGRARSLSASESGSRSILLNLNDDTNMSEDEPPIEPQPSVESESNDIIIDKTPSPDPSPLLFNNVNVKRFYGKSSKAPAPDFTTPPMFHGVDDQTNAEATPEVQMGDPLPPRTYIFTLDSLGTRHTAVYKTLNTYLKLEAKDKKDYDLTSEGVGMQALVPYQPNHCDCGVYLLHFAQTFMKDPGTYCNTIKRRRGAGYDLRQRQIDWDDTSVGDYREKLAARIKELSVIWKRDKGVKNPDVQEAQADPSTRASSSKTSPEIDVVPDSEGSDEDIEIVGMSRVHAGGKAKGTPRTKGRSQASRLRG